MILCLYCFQVLYSHAREARVVYSQTAKVTKLFVILPLCLMLKLVNDMLNIANIYYSARFIKTLVYLQLVFLLVLRRADFPFDQVPVPSVIYLDDTEITVTLNCDFEVPPWRNVSFEIQWFVNGKVSKSAQCDDPATSQCAHLQHHEYQLGSHVISFTLIYIFFWVRKSFTLLALFLIMHNYFRSLLACFESQNWPIWNVTE